MAEQASNMPVHFDLFEWNLWDVSANLLDALTEEERNEVENDVEFLESVQLTVYQTNGLLLFWNMSN